MAAFMSASEQTIGTFEAHSWRHMTNMYALAEAFARLLAAH